MKDFLEEYGFAILAAIVVILLIAFAGPVSNLVKNQTSNIINSFADKTSTRLSLLDAVDITSINADEAAWEHDLNSQSLMLVLDTEEPFEGEAYFHFVNVPEGSTFADIIENPSFYIRNWGDDEYFYLDGDFVYYDKIVINAAVFDSITWEQISKDDIIVENRTYYVGV